MTEVFLGVGSNIGRADNLCAGLDALQDRFGELSLSSVYESAAVGFDGAAFLNLAAGVECESDPGELARWLRQLEYSRGRPRDATRFSPRTLDIDILTFGDRVGLVDGVRLPRPEIVENAFVLCPLAELAPAALHPQLKRRYDELWADYDHASQPLERVDFSWRGNPISSADG